MAAQDCAKIAYDLGLRKVKAYLKGPGNGRESAVRTIDGAGIKVTEIIDVTPLPHNGCRPPKRRRVWRLRARYRHKPVNGSAFAFSKPQTSTPRI